MMTLLQDHEGRSYRLCEDKKKILTINRADREIFKACERFKALNIKEVKCRAFSTA